MASASEVRRAALETVCTAMAAKMSPAWSRLAVNKAATAPIASDTASSMKHLLATSWTSCLISVGGAAREAPLGGNRRGFSEIEIGAAILRPLKKCEKSQESGADFCVWNEGRVIDTARSEDQKYAAK